MGTYTLTGNANWSAIKAAVAAVGAPYTIVANGNWTLTLDENPALTDVTCDWSGMAAKLALGAPAIYALTGWTLRAGTIAALSVTAGKRITGPVTGYGGSASGAYGVANAGGTIDAITAFPGSVSSTPGCYNSSASFVGSMTAIAAGSSASYAAANYGFISSAIATGGDTASAVGLYTYSGMISNAVGTGGTVAGAHGIYAYGGSVYGGTYSGTVAGAYGLNSYGMSIVDVRNLSGYAVNRMAGRLILYGGTDQSHISGNGGDLRFIPVANDVRNLAPVLDELGTLDVAAEANLPATDSVDGGVVYGPAGAERTGTGMTAEQVQAAITAALADGVTLTPDAIVALETAMADDNIGPALKQAIVEQILTALPSIDELTVAAIAASVLSALQGELDARQATADRLGTLPQSGTVATAEDLPAVDAQGRVTTSNPAVSKQVQVKVTNVRVGGGA